MRLRFRVMCKIVVVSLVSIFFIAILMLLVPRFDVETNSLNSLNSPLINGSIKDFEIDWSNAAVNSSSIKFRTACKACHGDRWIVTASDNPPSENIRRLARLKSWKVVVVGSKLTPRNWAVPGVHFLSAEWQRNSGYRIADYLSDIYFPRRNIGYLFAIQNGAKFIYEIEEDSILLTEDIDRSFGLNQSKEENVPLFDALSSKSSVNPFSHFGQFTAWPRGLPLQAIEVSECETGLFLSPSEPKLLIKSGMINGCPDLDSVFHLTRVSSGLKGDINFNPLQSPAAIPPGKFSPFGSKNTLFYREAFWGLLLPISFHENVSDIFRGFWVQRVLFDLGAQLAFYPPSVRKEWQLRNEYEVFLAESQMHRSSRAVIDFLLTWRSSSTPLFARIEEIMSAMADKGLVQKKEKYFMVSWLLDLLSVGFTPPLLPAHPQMEPKNPLTRVTPKWTPFVPHSVSLSIPKKRELTRLQSLLQLKAMRTFFSNVVLIINFNHAVHLNSSIHLWLNLYSRIFPKIEIVTNQQINQSHYFTYYVPPKFTHPPAFLAYKPLRDIVSLHPNADGFLWTNDDVALSYWNLLQANKSKIWFIPPRDWHVYPEEYIHIQPWPYSPPKNCKWWCSNLKQFEQCFAELAPDLQRQFMASIGVNSTERLPQVHAYSDVYYFPSRLSKKFLEALDVFGRNNLRSEVAIPSAFSSLEPPSEFDQTALKNVRYVWGVRARRNASGTFSPAMSALHPWKLGTKVMKEELLKALSKGDPSL